MLKFVRLELNLTEWQHTLSRFADRAIFLEKGEVKFEGSAQDLMNRDDLARAVFFGTEGG